MPNTPEGLQAQIDATEDLAATLAGLTQVLARDRSRDRRRTVIEIVAGFVVTVGMIVTLVCVGIVLSHQDESAERGKRIEQSTAETHDTAVRIACLFDTSFNNPPAQTPAESQALLDKLKACIANDGTPPAAP